MRLLILVPLFCGSAAAQCTARFDPVLNRLTCTSNVFSGNVTVPATAPTYGPTGTAVNVLQPGLWNMYPHLIDTGAGTEGSPWTHSDTTAGVQTSVDTIGAIRSGAVTLAPGRFNFTGTVNIPYNSIKIQGVSKGYLQDPAGIADGLWGSKIKWAGGAHGVLFSLGSTNSGGQAYRAGAITLRDLYIFGSSRTPTGANNEQDVCIYNPQYTDQFRLENSILGNCGVGFHAGLSSGSISTDTPNILYTDFQGVGIGILLVNGREMGNALIHGNGFYDSDGQGIYLDGSVGFGEDHPTITNNRFYDLCNNGAVCLTHAASVVNFRPYMAFSDNQIEFTGRNPSHNAQIAGDGLYQAGDYGTITGNHFLNQGISGDAGIRLVGAHNTVTGNTFRNNDTDLIITGNNNKVRGNDLSTITVSGNDNVIDAPGATVTDTGQRNVINGVGTNGGDPNTTGNWSSATKWAGLRINDTSNGLTYIYTSAGQRVVSCINGSSYSSTCTTPYQYYRTATVQAGQVTGTLSNTSVLVDVTDTQLKTVANGGAMQNTNGYDLLVTTDLAGLVPVCFETDLYDATNGRWVGHVFAPSIAVSTVFYIHNGEAGINSPQGTLCAAGTAWPNHKTVIHFQNSSGTLTAADSSPASNSGTVSGATQTTGQINIAGSFAGGTNSVTLGNSSMPSGAASRSIQAWAQCTGGSSFRVIGGQAGTGSEGAFGWYIDNSRALFAWTGATNPSVGTTMTCTPGTWYHLANTYDGTTLRTYVNGVAGSTATITLTTAAGAHNGIGRDLQGAANSWVGLVDEWRETTDVWSANQVVAMFNSQSAPASFWTFGAPTAH